ncbi:MAG: ABC transporter ATP-binding protein [Candidatus Korobacteraceae bacterium]|jgi:NitT/TauT family transport system ATP-binding protein
MVINVNGGPDDHAAAGDGFGTGFPKLAIRAADPAFPGEINTSSSIHLEHESEEQSLPSPGLASEVLLRVLGLSTMYAVRGKAPFLAFSGVDVEIRRGELLVLVGASGCGKSSLLQTIAGLTQRRAGTVQLESELLTGPDPRLAVVFQDPVLLPWLTARQNVDFGLQLRSVPVSPEERKRRVAEAIADVGLTRFERAYPSQLSGGMAQRVALARALVRKPAILLLDEPFGALDAVTRRDMQRLLQRIIRTHHSTAMLVTHDVDEAVHLADRVILMGRTPDAGGQILHEFQLRDIRSRKLNAAPAAVRRQILEALSQTMGRAKDSAWN